MKDKNGKPGAGGKRKRITPTPEDLQRLFDLPNNLIPQGDLIEIFNLKCEMDDLRTKWEALREDWISLRSQLASRLAVGHHVERGRLKVEVSENGELKIAVDA